MGSRAMRKDIFIIKAVESKGYDLEEIIKKSNDELDKLPLSVKIIEGIKEYKLRGGKTSQEIAEEIALIMLSEPVIIENDENVEHISTLYKQNTEEQQSIIDDIQESIVIPVDEVQIVRPDNDINDIKIIEESLRKKEFKSFAPYLKHLKVDVPEIILKSVDGTKINDLIESRIAQVKKENK